ncbi:hypothetical protein FWK35_00030527 [Aphis craccivora]|uniref:Uncharacterized protein n=1 Tax=Aphis craccivora TaxID=307492 RepID=A0A6G0Y309_APHCR|nr:hypothetical protein FWK35_00030527 [Aphis craccivora]
MRSYILTGTTKRVKVENDERRTTLCRQKRATITTTRAPKTETTKERTENRETVREDGRGRRGRLGSDGDGDGNYGS